MGQAPEGNQPWVFPLPSKVKGSPAGTTVGIETFWKRQAQPHPIPVLMATSTGNRIGDVSIQPVRFRVVWLP